MKKETLARRKGAIVWINFTLLDLSINRAACTDIVQEFSKLGYDSSLISARSGNVPQIETLLGRFILVPLKRLPLVLPAMYAFFMSLFLPLYLLVSRPDFVIMEPGVYVLSAFPSFFVSKLKKVKFVLDVRSVPVETVGLRGFLEKFWFFVSVVIAKRFFDGMTMITPLMRQEISNNFNIDSGKAGVWTSGVSDRLFDPENLVFQSSELKRNLGLSGKFVVFYHGVFTATRGLDQTIEAIGLLKPRYPEIVFFLLGDGPIVDDLKTLVKKKGLQENVFIHNKVEQSEVPNFISMCDVGIVPLPYNQFWRFQSPLKLFEYLSMKKVTIVSDIPAHRSVVNDEKCAIYISSVNPIEIAKSIEYAYINRNALGQWGNIGREIIKREYTWEKVAKDLEKYLISIS